MRLVLLLPDVQPEVYEEPEVCPYPGCGGKRLYLRQLYPKRLRDTLVHEVRAKRYQCLKCFRTFRVYPKGVSKAKSSPRLRGLAVLLYLLGLSYGAVALALRALGHPLCKSRVYYAVQEAGQRVRGLRRQEVMLPSGQGRIRAIGADLTTVRCKGRWLGVGVVVDASRGTVLTVDILGSAEGEELLPWVREVAQAVGAEVLVSDDADAFKRVADDAGLEHQVCKAHVVRNTEEWVTKIRPLLERDADGSLGRIGVTPEQAVADCEQLLGLLTRRLPTREAEERLEQIHLRYRQACAPRVGEPLSLAYRMRLFSLDRWNLWGRLTLYRRWRGEDGTRIDGTNNACERALGWWIKERYRSMRGDKRELSVLNVSRLIAWAGNALGQGGANLAEVMT